MANYPWLFRRKSLNAHTHTEYDAINIHRIFYTNITNRTEFFSFLVESALAEGRGRIYIHASRLCKFQILTDRYDFSKPGGKL